MSKIKLIALDMDGTVLDDDKNMSERTLAAVKGAIDKGIKVVSCTGRPITGMPESFAKIEGIEYAIVSNGASVIDLATGDIIYDARLPVKDAETILSFLQQYDCAREIYYEGTAYTERETFLRAQDTYDIPDAFRKYLADSRICVDDIMGKLKEMPDGIEKVYAYFNDQALHDEAFEKIKDLGDFTFYIAWSLNIEVGSINANKGKALEALAKHLGIKKNEIMACGDSENDEPMLEAAGFPVAMGNGTQGVKERAIYITLSNNDDGVANAIEKIYDGDWETFVK